MSIAIGTSINIDDPKLDYFAKKQNVTHDVELEDIEIAVIARQAAVEDRIKADLEGKFTDVKGEWRDKIDRQTKKCDDLRADIARGKQTRTTSCDQIFHSGQIVSFDRETGLVVHVRNASPGEAQKALPTESGGLLAQAAKAQKDAHVEETPDGDVIPPDGSDEPKQRGKKK